MTTPSPSSSSTFPVLSSAANFKNTPLEVRIQQQTFIDQCSYNCSLILEMARNRNQYGEINPDVKISIASIVQSIQTVIDGFAISSNLTSISVDKQLGFYFPVYTGVNTGDYIRVGDDVDLKDFLAITSSTNDATILTLTSTALNNFKKY